MMRLTGLVLIKESVITIFGTGMPRKWCKKRIAHKSILGSEAPNKVHVNIVISAFYLNIYHTCKYHRSSTTSVQFSSREQKKIPR